MSGVGGEVYIFFSVLNIEEVRFLLSSFSVLVFSDFSEAYPAQKPSVHLLSREHGLFDSD